MGCLRFTNNLFFFHSAILKPDCDLALGKVGRGGNPSPFLFGNELAGRVLLLQFFQLDFRVRDPFLPAPTVAVHFWLKGYHICEDEENRAEEERRWRSQVKEREEGRREKEKVRLNSILQLAGQGIFQALGREQAEE